MCFRWIRNTSPQSVGLYAKFLRCVQTLPHVGLCRHGSFRSRSKCRLVLCEWLERSGWSRRWNHDQCEFHIRHQEWTAAGLFEMNDATWNLRHGGPCADRVTTTKPVALHWTMGIVHFCMPRTSEKLKDRHLLRPNLPTECLFFEQTQALVVGYFALTKLFSLAFLVS